PGPSPRSRRPRSSPGASPHPGTGRAASRSRPAAAAFRARPHAPARAGRRAGEARRRRASGARASFALGGHPREAPESLAIGEHQPAIGLVVVPDLQPRLPRRGLPLLDLVGRSVADVRATHVGAPTRPEAEEVLLGVAHTPEELDLELVPG